MDNYVTIDVHNECVKRMEDENNRQNHRLAELEKGVKEIKELTISVGRMAVSVEAMAKELEKQGERLDAIEKEPADKWKNATSIVVTIILTALVTFFLSRIGL